MGTYAFDLIGVFGEEILLEDVRSHLRAAGSEPIQCRIFSEGGEVPEAFAIFNALRAYPGKKTAIVDAAFSAASYVAMAFDEVLMPSNGYFMIHNAHMDDAEMSQQEKKLLDSMQHELAKVYSCRTGQSSGTIRSMMAQETFLTATESVRYGFADRVANETALSIAARMHPRFKGIQRRISARLKGNNPKAQWLSEVRSLTSKGVPFAKAVKRVEASHPGLRQRVVDAANR
jgi:ATP-dependent protease ClpP protease subunit